MAVTRQANLLSQQRLDIPHLRAIESSVAGDFDVLAGRSWGGQAQLVVRGFTLGNIAVNTPAVSLQLSTADGIAFNSQATEAGTMLWVPADRATETLNPVSNSKISGGWTPSTTNYVGIDFVRSTDATTTDLVQFLDAVSALETPKQVPLARTLDYRIVIGTVPFSGQPNLVPIAKVTLNGSGQVTAVEDARPLMFRLGQGGDSPNKYSFFGDWTRKENFGILDSTLFTGGDKGISGLKDWQDSVMTRLWEVGGGEFWYSATADRNVHMVTTGLAMANGDYWTWTLGTQTLQWQGIQLLFDNSTAYRADVVSGSITPLLPGECLYVDVDRTKFYAPAWTITTPYAVGDLSVNGGNTYEVTIAGTSAGAGGPTGTGAIIVDGTVTWKFVGPGQAGGLTMAKAALQTLGPGALPGSRWILAWRRGADVFSRDWRYPVGTLFIPATTTAQGVLKITRDHTGTDTVGASALNDPKALSDRGGTIFTPAIGNVGLTIRRFDGGANMLRLQDAAGATTFWSVDNGGAFNATQFAAGSNFFSFKDTGTIFANLGTSFAGAISALYIFPFVPGPQNASFEIETGASTARIATSVVPFFDIKQDGFAKWRFTSSTGALTGLVGGVDILPAQKYQYTTPRLTRSFHIPPAAFKLNEHWSFGKLNSGLAQSGTIPSAGGKYHGDSLYVTSLHPGTHARVSGRADVHLPHGAVITGITVLSGVDYGGSANFSTQGGAVNLFRNTFSGGIITRTKLNTTQTFGGGSGSGDEVVVENTLSCSHTVDNTDAWYDISLEMNSQHFYVNVQGNLTAGTSGGGAMSVLKDGRVLVCGGKTGGGAVANAYIYDPVSGKMTAITSMNNARADHRCFTFANGTVVVIGGHSDNGGIVGVTTDEFYDPEANTWTNISGTIPNPISPVCIMLPNGSTVLCLGGTDSVGTNTPRVLSFVTDSGHGTLSSSPSDRTACGLGFYRTDAALGGDTIRLGAFGGGGNTSGSSTSWDSYNTFTDTWTAGTGTLSSAVNAPVVVTTKAGNLYILGAAAGAVAHYAVHSGGGSSTLTFNTITAPVHAAVGNGGPGFQLPDGRILCIPGATGFRAQIFDFQGLTNANKGTWTVVADGDGTSVEDSGFVAAQQNTNGGGDAVMLPSGEVIVLQQATALIHHVDPYRHTVSTSQRRPAVHLYGVRVNYSLTEVNVEM